MFTGKSSYMSIKSRNIPRRQTCIPFSIKDLQMPFQKVPFYRTKGRLSHIKRAPFTLRKGIFCRVKVHLLFSIYESLLQPFLCPCSFHNKRVSLPPHYYNNTIKRLLFKFPVTPVTPLHVSTH